MKRRLHQVAAFASLVLCVGALVIWPLSYSLLSDAYGPLRFYAHGELWTAGVYAGDAYLNRYLPDSTTPLAQYDVGWHLPYVMGHRYFEWGFQRWSTTVVSLWFVASLCAILPTVRFVPLLWRREKPSERTCARCGYDLRATPDRCPECGTPIPKAST